MLYSLLFSVNYCKPDGTVNRAGDAATAAPPTESCAIVLAALFHLPGFPSQRNLHPRAERQRQSRETKSRVVMLAAQIFNAGVERQSAVDPVGPGKINLLISRRQIAIRQKHRRTEEAVGEERTVIAAGRQ